MFQSIDADVWRGFADRCHELESQLEILIDKFKGEKMAGKMARQEKNLNDTIKLINSLEQKLTRSKLRRLNKAMPNLTEGEQQIGLIEGKIIFTKDMALITESLRDLSRFLEAELSQNGERITKGEVMDTELSGGADKQLRPSGFLKLKKKVKRGKSRGTTKEVVHVRGKPKAGKSTDNKEKPQGGKSTDNKEQTQDEKSTKSKEQPQDGESTEKKEKGGSSQEGKEKKDKGASGKSDDVQDDIMKAMQGKVGELGDQLGGQVKQLGDRVFQGLVQKFKP